MSSTALHSYTDLSKPTLQQRLIDAFDRSPTPVFVTDDKGALEFANRAFCLSRTCSPQEACDLYTRDFWSHHRGSHEVAGICGELGSALTWKTEVCLKQADGENRWEEVQLSALLDEAGQLNGVVGSLRDITLRKQTEFALRKKEEQMRRILQAAHDSIIIFDDEGNILFWNAAASRIYGYSLEEAMGKHFTELLVVPREIETARRAFSEFRVSGVVTGIDHTTEFKAMRKDRCEIMIELSLSALNFEGQYQLLGVSRDVTERKKAEMERELLLTSLEQALANVKTLRGLVPICADCKKIRDDKGFWNQLESYVAAHSEAKFSHGICPECAHKLYPQFAAVIEAKQDAQKRSDQTGAT